MKLNYQAPRGTQDFLPEYMEKWRYIEQIWRKHMSMNGFGEIVTPEFESTELFKRTSGASSDIVSKEMYTFQDRGGRDLSLRPEGTAPVMRAYLQNALQSKPKPIKLFYLMPMFRYERPQAGRYRQHYQYGVEVIGLQDPFVDAEVISTVINFYKEVGIIEPLVHLNNIGDKQCRPQYRTMLTSYLTEVRDFLCEDCQNRMLHNPLRVLDCKNPTCQSYLKDVPMMVDNLCEDCQRHFDSLRNYMEIADIPYTLNPKLVRGLDYYTRTVFEVSAKGLTMQEVIAGGGRYDDLVELLGGPSTPSMGFGAGMERLISTLESHKAPFPEQKVVDVYIVLLRDDARSKAFELLTRLRNNQVVTRLNYKVENLRPQLEKAFNAKAKFALILGDEIEGGIVGLRNLETREQANVTEDKILDQIREWTARSKLIPENE